MTKRRNSIAEFSFQLSDIPTHYCPSDNGSIYNTSNDSESVCYLRQSQDHEDVVPDLISNSILAHHHHKKNRATPPSPPQPLVKKFPHRSLSDSVLVVKEKSSSSQAIPSKIIPSWKPASHDEKPPYSYATLIAYAILTSPDRKLPLSDIYMTISGNFPYYVLGDNGWQVRLFLKRWLLA
jgi:Forkhead domain